MFTSDADLNLVLTVAVLAPRARLCVHEMQSQPHLLLFFLHGSLWGHAPRPNQHSALHPSPWLWQLSDCTAGNPMYQPRSVTVPGVCCVRRKVPGVPWLLGEE